jgi:hypothetical protein
MDQLEYQTAYLAHLQAELEFRKAQETATQKRHEETQAYGKDYLQTLERQREANALLAVKSTEAQMQRAQAEQAMATAALEAAKAQREAAAMLVEDKTSQIVAQAISRMNDRTGTTSTADIPRAVREVLETMNETSRQFKVAGNG